MLDLITKGYIAAKLKIEDMIADQQGGGVVEAVIVIVGIGGVAYAIFGKDGTLTTELTRVMNILITKLKAIV